ncbi:3-oxoacyl-ACP synthase [Candidatus Termititenax persephonae]|uniref:3-oxoacyl-ACP synthase n=1 Tax=Candidatus Termititenax persephonae TaxID=2218525 RepID=A0A388TEG1_9BACT|nr:3-oxoacyl-ACP synthase [Candidatus Termititenax persephonae]
MQRRVVITGLGPISPIGKERETFWRSLVNGVSGIRLIPEIAASPLNFKTKIGGVIPDFNPQSYLKDEEIKHFSRFTQLAVVAADIALADAHLTVAAEDAARLGVIMGTGIGGHEVVERLQKALLADQENKAMVKTKQFIDELIKQHAENPLEVELVAGLKSKTLGDFLTHHFNNYFQAYLLEQQLTRLDKTGEKDLINSCAKATFTHAAAAEISAHCGLSGVNYSLSTGCSASANAIGAALNAIREGKADVVLSGGAEAPFTDMVYASFDFASPRQMSVRNDTPAQAITPYAKNRDGFLLAEGAGVVVLEELEHALRRGAYIYGELLGFGSAANANISPAEELKGAGLAQAMEAAIKDADITPYELDYICSHGSGSAFADLKETNAVKRVLGERAKAVPVSTVKSAMGMPFGASTAFQLIASSLMLDKQIVIPTLNLETPDPNCDLDYVPRTARPMILNYILLDSIGLGGNNAALVIKKYK